MPGISFIYNFDGGLKQKKLEILRSLDSLIHNKEYKREILLDKDECFLACTRYPNYPVTSFENDELNVYIEGRIYNKKTQIIKMELIELANDIFHYKNNVNDQIAKWLLNSDGEFIIFMYNKRYKKVVILNDILGHLPLYYCKKNKFLFVSREIRFIQNLIPENKLDKMSIAQYLLFSFTLGSNTLLEGVSRLKPGSLMRIALDAPEVTINNIYQFNFEHKRYRERTLQANIDKIITLWYEACKSRANFSNRHKNVLSLSGGLDSRSVGAALYKTNIPFDGVTFLDFEKTAIVDIEVAKEIAETWKVNLQQIKLNPPKGKDALKLLEIKCGLNTLKMRFIIPFFEKIKEIYGTDITYFTGDTGMILRDYSPVKKLNSLDEIVKYILSTGGRFSMLSLFSLQDVSRLTGIDEDEIIEEIKKELMSYPELDFNQKYVHFIFSGYCFNWHYEGMDRNRFYFWLASPFESIKIFHYVMNCPDNQKKYYKLYREFITKLSPQTRLIKNATWNTSINSKKALMKLILDSYYKKLPSRTKGIIRNLFRRYHSYSYNSNIMRCFQEQLISCRYISDYFSIPTLKKISKKCNKQEFEALFTIISTIEDFKDRQSTIQKYRDMELT